MSSFLLSEELVWKQEFEKITKKLRECGYDFSKVKIVVKGDGVKEEQ